MKKAFTLIELLIVVAIIAILAAIAVPNFLEAQTRAKVSRNRADMRSIATALEAYAVDVNKYPAAIEAFQNQDPNVSGFSEPPFHSRTPSSITTPIAYMTSIPHDPFREKFNTTGDPFVDLIGKDRIVYFNFQYNFSVSNGLYAPPAVNNFTKASALAGQWLLYSVGPDKDEFNTPVGASLLGLRVYRDYDPTNGTVSLGNVFRTQANGERIGVDPYFYTTP